MSYIGKSPSIGSYSMLDNLTASATASYSLTLDSVAFVPESANHLLVSLNGVIQKAGSSFTVSSSTLTFSSALTSSDSIDFVLALGSVLDIGTPSDATVTNAKTNFVSTSSAAGLQIKGDNTTGGTLQLNCEQNSHGIKLRSPAHSAGQSYTLTFPTGNVTADKVLKVASVSGSGSTGVGQLEFGTAGGLVQVLHQQTSTQHDLSSASFQDVNGMSLAITPSSSSNKILVRVGLHGNTIQANRGWKTKIVRTIGGSATTIFEETQQKAVYGGQSQLILRGFYEDLDSPSTTSATTYKVQAYQDGAGEVQYHYGAPSFYNFNGDISIMATNLGRVIKAINPDAEFSIVGNDIDKIEWLNGTTPISKEDIQAKISEVPTDEEFITANKNLRTSGKAKLKSGDSLTDDEISALFGD